MTLKELVTGGGGLVLIALTLVQITPVKLNPWSAIARAIGKAINGGDVMAVAQATQHALDVHIVDGKRERILRFNAELLRNIDHTEEEFIDILLSIDTYERYCAEHKEYQNNRAVLAISNIKRVYDERLKKGDFL